MESHQFKLPRYEFTVHVSILLFFKEMKSKPWKEVLQSTCLVAPHSYSYVSSVSSNQCMEECFGQQHILVSLEMSVQYLILNIKDHTLAMLERGLSHESVSAG